MDNYTIYHYVEKTYFDGSIQNELVKERDPLQVKSELSLVAIRFYDRDKPTGTFKEILKGEAGEPYNYSNYYYYGERKTLSSLEEEYKLLENLRPGTNKSLKNTINKLLLTNNDEIIVDYRYNPFNPYEVFPNKSDMTMGEYRNLLNQTKIFKDIVKIMRLKS